MELLPDWLEFIDSFNSNGVEYMVVGAFAMGLHRLPRTTGDIDFFVRVSPENSRRIYQAIADFGFGNIGLRPDAFEEPNQMLMLGRPPGRIDIITNIDGVTFEEAYSAREFGELGGRKVPFISRDHLLKNKLATGRLKDMADAQKLLKRTPKR